MAIDKFSSTSMLLLKLLEEKDMYGYLMIEELSKRSNNTFNLKAGTLYPILHGLEKQGLVTSYDTDTDSQRVRKYYHITKEGREVLKEKKQEWVTYSSAVQNVLNGGLSYARF